jgi:hypothetical protein
MKDLILPDGDKSGLGKLKPQDFSRVARILLDLNLINHIPAFADFYRGSK